MTDDILTGGLQQDRYLKALRLVHQFETTILETLEVTGREMLQDGGFKQDVSFSGKSFGEEYSATLATIRTEGSIIRDGALDSSLKLNLAVEWIDPAADADLPSDGSAFGYVLYKIQHGSQAAYQAVKDETANDETWAAIRFDEDKWYNPQKHAPGIVALSLADGAQLDHHLQTLQEHFTTVYAPELQM